MALKIFRLTKIINRPRFGSIWPEPYKYKLCNMTGEKLPKAKIQGKFPPSNIRQTCGTYGQKP